MEAYQIDTEKQWFALRDLKRTNALLPAYKQLSEAGMEVFTPMVTSISVKGTKRIKKRVPVMHDLLFVNESRKNLDPIVAKTPTLQYRFKRGGKQGEPIVIDKEEMERFITAVRSTDNPKFYAADEISSLMCGRTIRMVGGMLNGYEGKLQSVRGSKNKHLIITLSSLMAVSVCIHDEFVEVL
uniref:UpxY family transcription antiterminator n=1 Tax=Alistipes sp. TaxID=1872444 RepID=UPI004057615A